MSRHRVLLAKYVMDRLDVGECAVASNLGKLGSRAQAAVGALKSCRDVTGDQSSESMWLVARAAGQPYHVDYFQYAGRLLDKNGREFGKPGSALEDLARTTLGDLPVSAGMPSPPVVEPNLRLYLRMALAVEHWPEIIDCVMAEHQVARCTLSTPDVAMSEGDAPACAACGGALPKGCPVVLFECRHMLHQGCISAAAAAGGCPLCAVHVGSAKGKWARE